MGAFTALPQLKAASVYIAVLLVLGLVLTILVVRQRRAKRISLGDGNDRETLLAIRAHGNFSEQAPMIMIALLTLAGLGASLVQIHIVGLCGVLGRGMHALSIHQGAKPGMLRIGGMLLTFTSLLVASVSILLLAL